MDNVDQKALGQRIRKLRVEQAKSQGDLGRYLGRTHAAVSDIELGKTNLTVQDLTKIAAFLGMSVSDVLNAPVRPQASLQAFRYAKGVSPDEERRTKSSIDDFMKRVQGLGDDDAVQ